MGKTASTFILSCLAGLYAHGLFAAQSGVDPWQSVQFLLGSWQAKTEGGSAKATGSGTYTFRRELGNHILARYSGAKGPVGSVWCGPAVSIDLCTGRRSDEWKISNADAGTNRLQILSGVERHEAMNLREASTQS